MRHTTDPAPVLMMGESWGRTVGATIMSRGAGFAYSAMTALPHSSTGWTPARD
ncbi:hypothetical protein HGA13_18395 [Nocardia speluncae]|uniref:Uncharacterized protein n=1 Tax=Nocardia speluncae TaxID=419477 RepID=A0A846XHQ8_9NOCA|nr:hypothetical protein [Nocardia speluncae]NKY35027.1 hypothetical protein [Nocardia speluncae]